MDIILKKYDSGYTLEDTLAEEDKEASMLKRITSLFNEKQHLEDILTTLYKEDHFVVYYPEGIDEVQAKKEYYTLIDAFSEKNQKAKKRNTFFAFLTIPFYYLALTKGPAFLAALPPLNFFVYLRRYANTTVIENVEEAKKSSEFKPLSQFVKPKKMELYLTSGGEKAGLYTNYFFKERLEDRIKQQWLKKVVHACGGNLDDNELIIRKLPNRNLAVFYSSHLNEGDAKEKYCDLLDSYYTKHKQKLVRNSFYLAFSALLTPIPGPNLLADYVLYCMYLNYCIMKKAKQGKNASFYKTP